MGIWSVNPSNGVTFDPSETSDEVTISFPENNTSIVKKYVVRYDDGQGNCGSYTVEQKAGSQPGPSPSGDYGKPGTLYFKIVNHSSRNVTLNGELNMELTNPYNGYYYGPTGATQCRCYAGSHNRLEKAHDIKVSQIQGVTINSGGESVVFPYTYSDSTRICKNDCNNVIGESVEFGIIGRELNPNTERDGNITAYSSGGEWVKTSGISGTLTQNDASTPYIIEFID